jgi:uncharacterized membrane protein YdbT with pleckstrin-like domain
MGYPERLLSEGESVIREFRPHWRMLALPAGWTILFGAIIALTWIYWPDNEIFDWVVTGAALIAWIRLALYPFISWWFTWYILTNERLISRRGILARKGLEIPLERINDVQFSQTILERVLRSGDLLIESAGELGQSRFNDIPAPEEFQSLLYSVREDRTKDLSGVARSSGDSGTVDQLERLGRLLKDGLITQEEYDTQKKQLLG